MKHVIKIVLLAAVLIVELIPFSLLVNAQTKKRLVYSDDHDYIDVLTTEKDNTLNMYIETDEFHSVDWVGYVSRLDPKQFRSAEDFNYRSSLRRTVFSDEGEQLGIIYAGSKSWFRYADVIGIAIKKAEEKVIGKAFADTVSIPSNKDSIYLIRSFSGSWGVGYDKDEKNFVKNQVYEGKERDANALSLNLGTAALDLMGIIIPLADFTSQEVEEIAVLSIQSGLSSFSRMGDKAPDLNDFMEIVIDINSAILKKVTSGLIKSATTNLTGFLAKNSAILVKAIDVGGKLSNGGMILDRATQMILTATPLETAYLVVGNPIEGIGSDKFAKAQTKKIAFVGTDNNIWLIDSNGTNKEKLTDTGSAFFPVQSPDGKYILFTQNRKLPDYEKFEETDIYLLEAQTKKINKIARAGLYPEWFPDSKHIFYLDKMRKDLTVPEGSPATRPTGRAVVLNVESGEQNFPLDDEVTLYTHPELLKNGKILLTVIGKGLILSNTKGEQESLTSEPVVFYSLSANEDKVALIIYQEIDKEMGPGPFFGILDLKSKELKKNSSYIDFKKVIPEKVCTAGAFDSYYYDPPFFWDNNNQVFYGSLTGMCERSTYQSLFKFNTDLKLSYGYDMGITGNSILVNSYSLSPDRTKIVYFAGSGVNEGEHQSNTTDIVVLDLASGDKQIINKGSSPSW